MSRKHYIELAATLNARYNTIREYAKASERELQLDLFTCFYNDIETFCARQNAHFDFKRFHDAVFGGAK